MKQLFGGGGGGTPGFAKKAGKELWAKGKELMNTPFKPYEGVGVVPQSEALLTGVNAATGAIGTGQGAVSSAISLAKDAAKYTPTMVNPTAITATKAAPVALNPVADMRAATVAPVAGMNAATVDPSAVRNVTAGSLMSADVGKYMDPYLRQVIDTTMADLARSRQVQKQADNAAAVRAGAFGGDRQAVVDAETTAAYDRNTASTIANLYSGGFDRAVAAIRADQDRALQADVANQGVGMQAGLANAGYAQDAASRNQATALDIAKTNAGFGQQAGMANQATAADLAKAQGTIGANLSLADAGAANTAAIESGRNALAGSLANQQAIENQAKMKLASADAINTAGLTQAQIADAQANTAMKAGVLQQGYDQSKEDFAYQQYLAEQQWPLTLYQLATGGVNAISGMKTGTSNGGMFGQLIEGAGAIGQAGGIGKLFGGMFACWVAREVYGVDNPAWLEVRQWVLYRAPKWFRRLYLTHGEKFAEYISDKPRLKAVVRWLMDKVR